MRVDLIAIVNVYGSSYMPTAQCTQAALCQLDMKSQIASRSGWRYLAGVALAHAHGPIIALECQRVLETEQPVLMYSRQTPKDHGPRGLAGVYHRQRTANDLQPRDLD